MLLLVGTTNRLSVRDFDVGFLLPAPEPSSVVIRGACLSGRRRGTRIGAFTGVHEILGYVSEFDIEVLGSPTQNVESLVRTNALSFHENAQGLTDRLARAEGRIEVLGSALFVFMGMRNRQCQARQRDKNGGLCAVDDTKGCRIPGVEVQRASLRIRCQRKGEHAPKSLVHRLRRETWPARVRLEVVDGDDFPTSNSVKRGPFLGALLYRVNRE